MSWNGVNLENTAQPKYLGVTFDRTLSYKQHIQNIKMKVATRINLLKKLVCSKWRTNTGTTRTTALAEYVASVWARSSHTDILDPKLNKAWRAITGCFKSIYVETCIIVVEWCLHTPGVMYMLEWKEPNRCKKRLPPCLATSQLRAVWSQDMTSWQV